MHTKTSIQRQISINKSDCVKSKFIYPPAKVKIHDQKGPFGEIDNLSPLYQRPYALEKSPDVQGLLPGSAFYRLHYQTP